MPKLADWRVAEALRLVRSIYDAPQKEVAKRAGIHPVVLAQYENGSRRPSPGRAAHILAAIVGSGE